MHYEDLRSFMIKRHELILELQETIKDREFDIRKLKEQVENQKETIQKRNQEIIDLKNEVQESKKELSDEMIKHAITSQHLETANKKISGLEITCKQLRSQLEEIPSLRKELEDLEIANQELERKLDEATEQIEQMRGDKTDKSQMALPEMEDKEIQTEEEFGLNQT